MFRVADALSPGAISATLKRILSTVAGHLSNEKPVALALKTAVTIESFAADCMNIILANRMHYNDNGPPEVFHTSFPELDIRHVTDEKYLLSRDLIGEILAFHEAVAISGRAVAAQRRNGMTSTLWILCSEHCAKLGQHAATLARTIRDAHGLSNVARDWEARDRLGIEMQRIVDDEAAWQSRRVENELVLSRTPAKVNSG